MPDGEAYANTGYDQIFALVSRAAICVWLALPGVTGKFTPAVKDRAGVFWLARICRGSSREA
ncbi:hypothetical protein CO613_09360 [Lysobacteraceae bacterium NML07-0707]|nr:hypothetical protein CO613_09360 [Xanthomonadaceae bacterium NML07-0707]